MKTRKWLLFAVLISFALVCTFGLCACGGENNVTTGDGLKLTSVTIDGVEGYRVTDCTSHNKKSYVIPDLYKGKPIIEIGNMAFGFYKAVSIEIGNNVISIGEGAFMGCESLKSIKIPSGVTNIRNSTFADCLSLTSVEIPDGVTCIGEAAFDICGSLTRVNS